MDKKIRKAVRTYLIEDNRVVVINYKEHDSGYYDIPGGKIEDGETAYETSIREFKEETGITITRQHCIGHNTIEYPERIFEFDVIIVDEYSGEPIEFEENKSMWFNMADLYSLSCLILYFSNSVNALSLAISWDILPASFNTSKSSASKYLSIT